MTDQPDTGTEDAVSAKDAQGKIIESRILVAALVLAPVLLANLTSGPVFFLTLPLFLAGASLLKDKVNWPHLTRVCIAGIVLSPLVAWPLYRLSFEGFGVMAIVSGVAFTAVKYGPDLIKRTPRVFQTVNPAPGGGESPEPQRPADTTAAPTAQPSALAPPTLTTKDGRVVVNSTQSVQIGRPPIIATTTERETTEGTEYAVTWTDYARLSFWDRAHLTFILPGLTIILFPYAMALSSYGGEGTFFKAILVLLALASIGIWAHKLHHERRRYSARSLIVSPNGSMMLVNPPSYDPNYTTDGASMVLADGLKRLTSIEYSKSVEWHWLIKECVQSADHWYDVHLLLGEEWRISISRNLGSRDHAHQITGHLNKLRAKLTRPGVTAAPAAERVLD